MQFTDKDEPLGLKKCGVQHPKREGIYCENTGECLGVHNTTIGEPPNHRMIQFCTNKTSTGKNPMATMLSDLVSLGHLQKIGNISARLGLDKNEVSKKLFNLKAEELSEYGADDVIKHLHELEGSDPSRDILEFKPKNKSKE